MKDQVVEAIRKHLRRPTRVQLTDSQKKLWEKIDHAWALLSDTKVIRTDVEKVDVIRHVHKVSTRTAYLYLQYAKELYGDVLEGKKEAERAIVYNYAVEAFKLAMAKGKPEAMSSAVSNMVKILGLDRDTQDAPDFKDIQPPTISVALPEETQKSLLKLVNAGVVDLNKMMPVEDAEYEELERDQRADK